MASGSIVRPHAAELRGTDCGALDSIIGDLEHSRTEIDNA
jgi:hypothetical protein